MEEIPHKTMIKVAQLNFSLDHGGAEMMIVDLVSGLDRREFSPVVCSLQQDGTLRKEIENRGIPVFEVVKKPGKDWRLPFRLYRFFKSQEIDIVHAHNGYTWLYSAVPARLAGVPVVYTEHSVHANPSKLFLLISRIVEKITSQIIVPSIYVRDLLHHRQRIKPKSIRTIYNGIDISRAKRNIDTHGKRKELGLSPETRVIGIIARLVYEKNHECLMDAMSIIASRTENAHLLIVGDGPKREALKQRVRELGLDGHVTFLGNRTDVPDLLQILDVFVLSSISEGFPVSILEAMAAGVPIVATAVGGVSEALADGLAGRLIRPGEPVALAEAVLDLLNDPGKAKTLKDVSYARVSEHFTSKLMVHKYANVYRTITGKASLRGEHVKSSIR